MLHNVIAHFWIATQKVIGLSRTIYTLALQYLKLPQLLSHPTNINRDFWRAIMPLLTNALKVFILQEV